jgi:hypothetical protein
LIYLSIYLFIYLSIYLFSTVDMSYIMKSLTAFYNVRLLINIISDRISWLQVNIIFNWFLFLFTFLDSWVYICICICVCACICACICACVCVCALTLMSSNSEMNDTQHDYSEKTLSWNFKIILDRILNYIWLFRISRNLFFKLSSRFHSWIIWHEISCNKTAVSDIFFCI